MFEKLSHHWAADVLKSMHITYFCCRNVSANICRMHWEWLWFCNKRCNISAE